MTSSKSLASRQTTRMQAQPGRDLARESGSCPTALTLSQEDAATYWEARTALREALHSGLSSV